jgi:hypothetical protein
MDGPWADMPVTIVDPKHSKLIAKLDAQEIKVTDRPPSTPGLYVIRPFPGDDDAALTEYLLRVWQQENHGTYFDEMLDLGPRNKGFRRLLSQGREKNCPMIYCTQRPRWVDTYAFTEADFVGSFHLVKREDRITVDNFAPGYSQKRLNDYHCYWYSVSEDKGVILNPCPPEGLILARYYPEYVNDNQSEYPEVVAHAEGERQKVLL